MAMVKVHTDYKTDLVMDNIIRRMPTSEIKQNLKASLASGADFMSCILELVNTEFDFGFTRNDIKQIWYTSAYGATADTLYRTVSAIETVDDAAYINEYFDTLFNRERMVLAHRQANTWVVAFNEQLMHRLGNINRRIVLDGGHVEVDVINSFSSIQRVVNNIKEAWEQANNRTDYSYVAPNIKVSA